jgi:hypothetical protein
LIRAGKSRAYRHYFDIGAAAGATGATEGMASKGSNAFAEALTLIQEAKGRP